MKRLLSIVIIIGIIAYITVQFLKDRRFNPPSDYDFPISENIDKEFYDRTVVKDYYQAALEVGTFARAMWRDKLIDVRTPKVGDEKNKAAAEYYNSLIATAQWLQDKLEDSKRYKDQGYNDTQIKMIMEHGLTPDDLELESKMYLADLRRGSTGAPVWELQKMLNQSGDSIPEDGLYNQITVNRVREFQRNNNLYPSGQMDLNTLKALLKQ